MFFIVYLHFEVNCLENMDKELNIKGLNMHSLFRMIAAILMLLISTSSYAALEGKGTEALPFKIKDPSDLPALRDYIAKNQGKYIYVVQESNIDLSDLSAAGQPPLPLSSLKFQFGSLRSTTTYFLGQYDGNGFTIRNWKLSNNIKQTIPSTGYLVSMFGKVGMANKLRSVIKNLNIEGFELEMPTNDNKNSVCGYSFIASSVVNTDIINCNVSNSKVYGDGKFNFGAISAELRDGSIDSCIVSNCQFIPDGASSNIGAICGSLSGTIKNCYAFNVVLNGDNYVGGIVGEINKGGSIENCGFNGSIGNKNNFNITNSGGICGRLNTSTSIVNCYSVFDNGNNNWNIAQSFGGIVGNVVDGAKVTVKNCYAYPQIQIKGTTSGVDYLIGKDKDKENSERIYESLYCYKNGFGEGFEPSYDESSKFSDSYSASHKLMLAEEDFMRSGCFAEVLSDYHSANLTDDNPWREDVELQNDTLPVLRFMINEAYDEDPFCHPRIRTLSNTKSGDIATIYGQLKYITDDQTVEDWRYGFEVNDGSGWNDYKIVIKVPNGNMIDFRNEEVKFNKKKTTVYRAYTFNPTVQGGRKAYGKVDTICVGSSSGPDIVEGCDSVFYDGKWLYPSDNGTYINSSNEEAIVKIGVTRRDTTLIENCGNSVEYDGVTYDHSGTYETSFVLEGCKVYNIKEVKLYPALPAKDSLKVFELGEMSYTYNAKVGDNFRTVKVGTEYVLEPKFLYEDNIKYANTDCDSLNIIVKYIIPIKETKTEDATFSCKPVVYNGVEYTKDTIVKDTLVTLDASVPGGKLYEIRTRHIKASVPDTIRNTDIQCGDVITYTCPIGICESDVPFYDTVNVKSTNPLNQCPAKVNITYYNFGEKPVKDVNITSCGPYFYTKKKKTWTKSGDYGPFTEKGENPELGCQNDTVVTYHLTINPSYNDTTIHGCDKVVYKTLSGETKTFKNSLDYEDVLNSGTGCSRMVHVYIHPKDDRSSVNPINGCAPYTYKLLSGKDTILEAGNHNIKETIKSIDDCECDSIVRTTILKIEEPKTFEVKEVNGCDMVEIEGVQYYESTEFVIEKQSSDLYKACRKEFHPYKVTISNSEIEKIFVDTCGSFTVGKETITETGKIEIKENTSTGCDNKTIYNVRIITPEEIDSFAYACDSYEYKYYNGETKTVTEDGTVIVDKIKSTVCDCDSVVRTVKINISHDSYETLPTVNNCGPYTYTKKANGKKVLIETSQIVYDTMETKYGCHIYYETEVKIIPVLTTIEKLEVCKEYNSVVPVFNYNNNIVSVSVNTPTIEQQELIFLQPNAANSSCMDTTKLFLTVHGVGELTAEPVVECDTFIYEDFDGSKKIITSSTKVVDTLKSKTCDCDSIILTTDVTINHSLPENLRKTNSIRECDSVVYVNSKGVEMIFKDDIQFLDTFQMAKTGCDSVVIVDVTVPKSTGSVKFLTACGDTTLYDDVQDNFPHFFDESGVWRQVLSENSAGCNNFIEWNVKIIPTPRDTIYETGCGELTFRETTYTSENENAASFNLEVRGTTKCDSIHNYILTVYPKYNKSESFEDCNLVTRNGIDYTESVYFVETLKSQHNCDSVINVNIVVNKAQDVTKYKFDCNEVKFVDEDFNGGLPIYVHQDTTIEIEKVTSKGCPYTLTQQIQVGYPSDSLIEIYECVDTKSGYVSYHDLQLTADTILYDTVASSNRCGTVITHDIKVERCFPYPVLVNKYNWILVCNDVIFDDDKFKLKSNVKYNWYKDDRLISSTSDSYFTEDKVLDGCYQVGIVIANGDEYLSDIVCIDENHEYTITPQPNPVDKLQPVTIVCDFPVEGVIDTDVEVFNMTAEKVYVTKATSNEIVIPGMAVSGYYFVRLTTVTGKVMTAKYMVK